MIQTTIIPKVFKLIVYFIGLNILSLGTVFFTVCHLGASPLVSLPLAISTILPITLGQSTTSLFAFFVLVQIILKKNFEWKIISQFIVAFLFGNIVDFYNTTIGLKHLVLTFIAFKIIVLLLANILTAIGVVTMIRANFILNPPDGLVNVISEKTGNSFGRTKVFFDLIMILSTLALSILFVGNISIIGIGTLVAVILVGNLVSFCNKVFKRYVPIKSGNKSN
ncbi:hypothetical protein EFM34_00085 [Leuconostoc suionicum]|uniref:YczE/YyaS/YitT family protein n=1 Tax=Leuconostoc suionicum TaxID=1511761 RepID=UPI0021AA99C6|nr:DUF6198 family protein [Leuconostoc suionicum]MCT4381656.1 hypothetical protein [Leuconostoc suionicum]